MQNNSNIFLQEFESEEYLVEILFFINWMEFYWQ